MGTGGIGTDRPVSPLDREAVARVEVGHTAVTPRIARALVAWFLLMLAALPLTELAGQLRAGAGEGPWSHLFGLPPGIERPLASAVDAPIPGGWTRVVTANRAVLGRLSDFETALEDQSAVGQLLRPFAQRVLSGWLGAGNERVYVGRDGWLFFRPDVEYLTGRGFLEPHELDRRGRAATEYEAAPQPDPRPAVLQFARDLEARGIVLVLVPTPVKPTIHPGQLARRYDRPTDAVLHNASYTAFVDEMRREGVLVFDAAGEAGPMRAPAGAAQYLASDTHWRPETMQRVAESLAAFLHEHVTLPAHPPQGYAVERREARQTGDTAAMLDLPEGQTLYPPEHVALRFVVDAAGDPWRSSRAADILLLGDSFTNIYSLATMGWGEAAGFAEQLSYTLDRPVDRIVQNDQGAHATRGLLRRDVGGTTDRLAGKRVVIWQFAARELAFGDWKVIALPR
jgi:hypothetical protein